MSSENNQQNNWDEFINGVLFAYRTSKQKSTQFTPFELMYCRCVAQLFLFATLLYMPHCPSLGSATYVIRLGMGTVFSINCMIKEYNPNSIAGNQFFQLSTRFLTLSLSVVWM